VFGAASLLREARRQRGLSEAPVPSVCLLDPDGDIAAHLRSSGRSHRSETWACYHSMLDVFELGGHPVGIVPLVVGAPYAVLVAEELFASGCQLLVSVTSAGRVAAPANTNAFMVIERALRDEGTSYHYLPPSRYSSLDPAIAATLAGLKVDGVELLHGATWTTDAPFRETPSALAEHRDEGILGVEMEAAALYALAHVSGRRVVCLAHLTNELGQEGDFEKGAANGAEAALAVVAAVVDALSRLAPTQDAPRA
jgi:uridine phosphorylase